MGTILVAGVLLLAVAAIVAGLIRDKQQGKTSCGCGCNCATCKGCRH